MSRRLVILNALISFLTGCARKPAAPPQAPGTSVQLSYPVLLAGQSNLVVKDNEERLTTTTVASGLNFPEFQLIDSDGILYSISKVTSFGKRSVFLDMGTGAFRVFLEMKRDRKLSLSQAKQLIRNVMSSKAAPEAFETAQSVRELIESCRNSWEWR